MSWGSTRSAHREHFTLKILKVGKDELSWGAFETFHPFISPLLYQVFSGIAGDLYSLENWFGFTPKFINFFVTEDDVRLLEPAMNRKIQFSRHSSCFRCSNGRRAQIFIKHGPYKSANHLIIVKKFVERQSHQVDKVGAQRERLWLLEGRANNNGTTHQWMGTCRGRW